MTKTSKQLAAVLSEDAAAACQGYGDERDTSARDRLDTLQLVADVHAAAGRLERLEEANKELAAQLRNVVEANISLTQRLATGEGMTTVTYLYGKPLYQIADELQELAELKENDQ